jgi:hypothetical protein
MARTDVGFQCMLYGMELMNDLSVSLDLLRALAASPDVPHGSILWGTVESSVKSLHRTIDNATGLCGINPETATQTFTGEPVIKHMAHLEEAVEQRDAERALQAAVNISAGLSRQVSGAKLIRTRGEGLE